MHNLDTCIFDKVETYQCSIYINRVREWHGKVNRLVTQQQVTHMYLIDTSIGLSLSWDVSIPSYYTKIVQYVHAPPSPWHAGCHHEACYVKRRRV
jgi:hypothetical protein